MIQTPYTYFFLPNSDWGDMRVLSGNEAGEKTYENNTTNMQGRGAHMCFAGAQTSVCSTNPEMLFLHKHAKNQCFARPQAIQVSSRLAHRGLTPSIIKTSKTYLTKPRQTEQSPKRLDKASKYYTKPFNNQTSSRIIKQAQQQILTTDNYRHLSYNMQGLM